MIPGDRISETKKEENLARRRYQRGSLMLRGKSWWARWWEDVIGSDGRTKRVQKSMTIGTRAEFPTRKLAQRQFDLVLARINDPAYRAGRVATFAAFAERWRTEILSQRKPSTRKVSEWHLRAFLMPEFGTVMLDQIGTEQAQRLIARLSATIAPKTVANVIGTLSAILNAARDWRYTASELNWKRLVFPQRRERPRRRFFSADQVMQIVEYAEREFPGEPWGLMFLLAAATGLRAGELLALKLGDLDFERRLLFVRRSVWYGHVHAPKSLASERVLPLPDPLLDRLGRYIGTWRPKSDGFLFSTSRGNPVPIQHVVQRKLWPVLDLLGIERCGLHAFRHAHSSMLVEMGAPMTVARDQLGHTDMRLTLGIYSHVISGVQRASVEKLWGQLCSNVINSDSQANRLN